MKPFPLRLFWAIPLSLLLLVGCATTQKVMDLADKASDYNHLLWKIESPKLTTPSYVYGTIHIIPEENFYVSDSLHKYFDQADRLVMEMDMDIMDMGMGGDEEIDFGQVMALMSEIMIKPPNSLRKLLSEEDYAYLQGFMRDSMETPIPFYSMFKPIFLTEQISISYCMNGIPESYELYLRRRAKEQEKPISGLETFEEQLSYIEEISLEDQAKSLMETVRNSGELCQEYQNMYRLYRNQRLDSLMMMMDEDPTLKEQSDNLLDSRNANWIPKLGEWMSQESLFIAVGAAHLPGSQGVVALLRKAGYRVTPIEFQ